VGLFTTAADAFLTTEEIAMRRVVVTGMGIVSCLGNNPEAVTAESLREGRSGIKFIPEYAERGLRSQVAAVPSWTSRPVDRKQLRFMGDAAAFAYIAMKQAIADAGLTPRPRSPTRAPA
jgi:3-oxoacyl-[acyl-carrier-protein] synthase-1